MYIISGTLLLIFSMLSFIFNHLYMHENDGVILFFATVTLISGFILYYIQFNTSNKTGD